jgi:hypothetical protein
MHLQQFDPSIAITQPTKSAFFFFIIYMMNWMNSLDELSHLNCFDHMINGGSSKVVPVLFF